MKYSQFAISALLLIFLIVINQYPSSAAGQFGGLSTVGWVSIGIFIIGVGLVVALSDIAGTFRFLSRKDAKVLPPPVRTLQDSELKELGIRKYRGPDYPHPVIFTERCIGCHACVDACPHDVLAIVDGRAAVVAADQCMEDTSCQVVCPVNPKACIVINTAKKIRSQPAPTRDAATYMTNIANCFIIGDVSGVPLIKNAVKEGTEVIEHIAAEISKIAPEPKAEYDVAVIGIGPGGASAILTAHEKGLRCIGIEQERILSTIEAYPKKKYIFFKPDSTDWTGGLSVAGLGLNKGKYDEDVPIVLTDAAFENALDSDLEKIGKEQSKVLLEELGTEIPAKMRGEITLPLEEKTVVEIKRLFGKYLEEKAAVRSKPSVEQWTEFYGKYFVNLKKSEREAILKAMRRDISENLRRKIPGDQRERILAIWHGKLEEKGVKINEYESCKSVKKADDGNYFIVGTERGAEKMPLTYRARFVVLAIGLRGSPNKLRVSNEETIKINLNGQPENKVLYNLSNPEAYKNRHIIIVGGGNSAVEAAVDLVARRDGSNITPRPIGERNKVTLLVRSFIATNVKFGNKLQLYQCMDDGLLDVRFGTAVKELREREVVVMDTQTKEITDSIPNDYVFALIGGERPDKFLESIGITIDRGNGEKS